MEIGIRVCREQRYTPNSFEGGISRKKPKVGEEQEK
jgi:hypothetical protein